MKQLLLVLIAGMFGFLSTAAAEEKSAPVSGEKLFARHCAVCHPQGGNIINPKKTLKKSDLEARNLKTVDDIVAFLRAGAPGMPKFAETALANAEAREIASYILQAFK